MTDITELPQFWLHMTSTVALVLLALLATAALARWIVSALELWQRHHSS
jgi:hypothetical protein